MWYADGNELSPAFLETMSQCYYAGVTLVDFTDTDRAVQLINSWCATKTANLIPNFLRDINPSTMAAWYNALYFAEHGLTSLTWPKPLSAHSAGATRKAL